MGSVQTFDFSGSTHDVVVVVYYSHPEPLPNTWLEEGDLCARSSIGEARRWLRNKQVEDRLIEKVTDVLTENDCFSKRVVLSRAVPA